MTIEVAIRHRFGAFQLDVVFVAGAPGLTALFGPSGAGKTTVINAIAGLLRPKAGRISVNGRVLFDSEAGISVSGRRRRVGYVFQDARLFPHLDVEANIRFGWRRAAARVPETEVARIVEMLGLGRLLRRKPVYLSGGEKARVSIARALLADPAILLLDEPLAALDAMRKNEILPYLECLRDEAQIPMLYVSHSLDEVSRLATDIVFLREGRVIAAGSIFDVLTDLQLPDLTGSAPYGAVIETTVSRHLPGERLSVLAFAGGELSVPLLQKPTGTRLRTHIRAEDIMLAREEPRAISANNVLPAKISAFRERPPAHVDVRLVCRETVLIARITHASFVRLALQADEKVFAIVKSVTVVPQVELRIGSGQL
jgi:molybdate transport system ATP-binding protein